MNLTTEYYTVDSDIVFDFFADCFKSKTGKIIKSQYYYDPGQEKNNF